MDKVSLSLRNRAAAICTALGVASAVAVGGAMVAPTAASAASSCPVSQMSATSQPSCWQPFTGGPFNTELSANPALAPNSAAVVSHMTQNNWSFGYPGYTGYMLGNGSRPVFFAKSTDPTMTIHCTDAFGPNSCTGANGVAIGGQTIHVPAGIAPENGTDAHLTVIEAGTGQEYDMWDASISGTTISAGSGSVTNTNTGNGLGAQGDAANFSLTAGLLRPSEITAGVINHPLIVTVPCTNANGASVGYSYPATGGWGEACGDYWNESGNGAPMLGQLLRLNLTDAQIAASPAPAWQKTIMTALSHYGAYIEDTDGSWNSGVNVITQDSESWTDIGQPDQWKALADQYHDANGMLSSNVPLPISEFQVVNSCVAQGTCPSSIAAPGTVTTPVYTSTPVSTPTTPVTTPAPVSTPATPVTTPVTTPAPVSTPAAPTTTSTPVSTPTKSTTATLPVHHKHHRKSLVKNQNKKQNGKTHATKHKVKHHTSHTS